MACQAKRMEEARPSSSLRQCPTSGMLWCLGGCLFPMSVTTQVRVGVTPVFLIKNYAQSRAAKGQLLANSVRGLRSPPHPALNSLLCFMVCGGWRDFRGKYFAFWSIPHLSGRCRYHPKDVLALHVYSFSRRLVGHGGCGGMRG